MDFSIGYFCCCQDLASFHSRLNKTIEKFKDKHGNN